MDLEILKPMITVSDSGCWEWNGSKMIEGYGRFSYNGAQWLVHRYAWTCVHGEIPPCMVVRHLCNNKSCCNPAHLAIGTDKDNWEDSEKTHRAASTAKAKVWIIDGVPYSGLRKAREATGLPFATILKYTEEGVFNLAAYREGCRIANKIPKV